MLSLNPVYVLATVFHLTEFICGFKIVIPFVIQYDFCFEIEKVTWDALSASIFSVGTILLRSCLCVTMQRFSEQTAEEN